MKVNTGITKGDNFKTSLKKLEYSKDWGKHLSNEQIKKFKKLQNLIFKIEVFKDEFEEGQIEAYHLSQFFKNKKNSISEIKFSTALNKNETFVVKNEILVNTILLSINWQTIKCRKPKGFAPKKPFTKLLEVGGYEIIKELQDEGFSQKFIFDFINNSVTIESDSRILNQNFIETENGINFISKINIASFESFKVALSNFKK
ncbi:MAG: hypothetical protein O9302_08735 [Cyclobacteriaceae bacterium]|jgi:hypothetical protein|nr:hypothetical protein [Cytophagales bacterium]MCZ8328130.1 hypothetical protein [Cyclobacteriaceae bacterium]